MGGNIVCTIQIDRKHDLLTILSSRGNAAKPFRDAFVLPKSESDFKIMILIHHFI